VDDDSNEYNWWFARSSFDDDSNRLAALAQKTTRRRMARLRPNDAAAPNARSVEPVCGAPGLRLLVKAEVREPINKGARES
jgi:hypothetical protein